MAKARQARNTRNTKSELARLRARLAEAEETLSAIRNGDVDAIAVDGPNGRQIFTLQSADQPYRILAERMNEGAATLTAEGTILFCNPRLAEMVGLPAERLLGSSVTSILEDGPQENFPKLVRQALKKEVRVEASLVRNDGTLLPAQLSLSSIPLEESEPGICLVAIDLSAQKRSEEANLRLGSIVNSSDDGIISKTLDGMVTSWNSGAEQIYGYSAEEMVGQSISRLVPPDRLDEFNAIMARIKQGQRVRHFETVRIRKGGQPTPMSLTVSPIKDGAGNVVGASTIARDITEQRQAEEKLRTAALYTRSLIEASLDPLVTISREGKITDVNEATERATGVSRDRLIGSEFCNYFTEPKKAHEGYQQVFATGFVRDYPLALRHTSGRVMDVLYNASVFKNEHGEVEGVFAAARDITDRKRAEEKMAEQAALLDLAQDAIIVSNLDNRVLFWSRGAIDMYGWGPEEAMGEVTRGFLKTEFPTPVDSILSSLKQEREWEGELGHTCRDGKRIIVASRWSLLRDAEGNPTAILEINRDITQRKQVEAKLREASLYTRSLIEASLDPLVTISREGKITDVNEATEKATGLSREELTGSDFSNYFTEPEQARRGYQEVFAKGLVHDYPLAIRHSSGRIIDVLYNASVFRDETGEIKGVFAAARDVTERKRTQEQLRKASLYTRSLIEASLDPLVTISREGKITDVNEATENATGIKREQLIGSDFCEYFTEPEKARQGYKKVFDSGFVCNYPLALRHTSGRVMDVLYNASVFENQNGEVEGVFAAARDVTERKAAEEQVRRLNDELEKRVVQRTAQLESANKELEAFTYSVSHDLRAPLRHISGFSKILSEEFGPTLPEEAQHHLKRIEDGTRRMGILVDDLLNLARIGRRELSAQVSGLRSIVDEVIVELKPEYEGREIEWKISSLPFVECDPGLVKQVFQNLIANALKFTRPRPRAVIELGQQEEDGVPAIYVRDNGVGFSMKYADKLFGVFQRLHRSEDFEGTGVGLATTQRIIQKHGGRIWAQAELDKGATFYFTLTNSVKNEIKMKAATAGDKP